MTYASDPPRLRTLARIPAELALALEVRRDEEASSVELERLGLAVRSREALVQPAAVSGPAGSRAPRRWRKVAVFRGALGVALLFALGAGAGGLVAGGLFFGLRWSGRTQAPGASNALVPQEATKPDSAAPRAVEPSSLDSAPSAFSRPPPFTAAPSAAPSAGKVATDETLGPTREAELGLLGRAQAALEANAINALALTSDHERKFPDGALVQEREVIAIDALLRLGRRPEAEARAARFRRRFSASVHARRVDVLLGISHSAPGDHN